MKTIPRKYPECFGLSLNLAVASPQPVSLEITFGPFGPFERHSYSAHGFTWFQDSPCFTQVLVTLCWELGAKYIETRGMNQTCSSTGCMELWVVWSHKPGGQEGQTPSAFRILLIYHPMESNRQVGKPTQNSNTHVHAPSTRQEAAVCDRSINLDTSVSDDAVVMLRS